MATLSSSRTAVLPCCQTAESSAKLSNRRVLTRLCETVSELSGPSEFHRIALSHIDVRLNARIDEQPAEFPPPALY
ncbi:MAG: hypothetical protein LBK67_10075 [Coriobacteriales bacterium]|nr:hypothetical protein [Coriobacteriales bacterium]